MRIEINELSKYYGQLCAVNKACFSFCSGRLTALVGRNGSGKTTAIRAILRLIKRDGGNIYIDGRKSEIDMKNVGYLAEERGLFLKETVLNQLIFFARLKGISYKKALKSIDQWLECLEIAEYKKSTLESLSKGNQQKIQMIASLVHDPDIIIFDEPFSGLDPVNMQLTIQLLSRLRDEGKCIMVSSHQLPYIEDICEDICIINKSNVIYYGSLKELKTMRGGELIRFSLAERSEIPADINAEEYAPLRYIVNINPGSRYDFNLFIQKAAGAQLSLNSIEHSNKSLQEIFLNLVGDE